MSENIPDITQHRGTVYEVGPVIPDPEALEDTSRRIRLRKENVGAKRYPFPIPNGWFVVAESRALAPGEMKSFYAFGKDLVLYRAESGEPRLVDAYCPHLGAHLGAGGKVEGDAIRCPFHGWRYDGASGKCNHIPYGSEKGENNRIPAGAKLRTYPLLERNHMIWAWHHLEGAEPFYEIPVFPELDDPDWLDYESFDFEVGTINQEFLEGEADLAHFKYVHGAPNNTGGPQHELTIDGAYRRNTNGVENWGLGCLKITAGGSVVGLSPLPIDEENVRVTSWFTAPRSMGEDAAKKVKDGFKGGYTQDLKIFENKRYTQKPLLLKSEKMIAELRKWSLQFYSGYSS